MLRASRSFIPRFMSQMTGSWIFIMTGRQIWNKHGRSSSFFKASFIACQGRLEKAMKTLEAVLQTEPVRPESDEVYVGTRRVHVGLLYLWMNWTSRFRDEERGMDERTIMATGAKEMTKFLGGGELANISRIINSNREATALTDLSVRQTIGATVCQTSARKLVASAVWQSWNDCMQNYGVHEQETRSPAQQRNRFEVPYPSRCKRNSSEFGASGAGSRLNLSPILLLVVSRD